MTYRPLPDGLCVRYDDKTGEHGLFALQDFPMGHDFGFARNEQLWREDGSLLATERSEYSKYVNCDDEAPNCYMAAVKTSHYGSVEERAVIMKASRNIEAGDELTVSYTLSEYGTSDLRPWDSFDAT